MKNKIEFVFMLTLLLAGIQPIYAQDTYDVDTIQTIKGNKVIEIIKKYTYVDTTYNDSLTQETISETSYIYRSKTNVLDSIRGNILDINNYVTFKDYMDSKIQDSVIVFESRTSKKDYFPILKENYTETSYVLKEGELYGPIVNEDSDVLWLNIAWWIFIFALIWRALYKDIVWSYDQKTEISKTMDVFIWIIFCVVVGLLWVFLFGYDYELMLFELYFFIIGLIGFVFARAKLAKILKALKMTYSDVLLIKSEIYERKYFDQGFYISKYLLFQVLRSDGLVDKRTRKVVISPDSRYEIDRIIRNKVRIIRNRDTRSVGFFYEKTGELYMTGKYSNFRFRNNSLYLQRYTDEEWMRIDLETGKETGEILMKKTS